MKQFPPARAGQELTPVMWEQARAFVLSNQLRSGNGIRLQWSPDGTTISADTPNVSWAHAFRVSINGGTKATIIPGFLNGTIEPEIKQIPLSGDDKNPPPTLEFTKLKLDATGRGYIAVEIACDDKWAIKKEHGASIVQVAYFDSDDGEKPPVGSGGPSALGGVPILSGRRARWPLALLVQRKSGRVDSFQITHGDLQFKASPRDSKSDTGRGFFW